MGPETTIVYDYCHVTWQCSKCGYRQHSEFGSFCRQCLRDVEAVQFVRDTSIHARKNGRKDNFLRLSTTPP